ncbi:MAG: hypothetical protein HC814_05905 [Rhodobacteraceae bacterium]|nr:hypothetical protein [Paracoccaceae bacterium]
MNAGKHVYCEKPMTRYLDEGWRVYDAVKKTGKISRLARRLLRCEVSQGRRTGERRQDRPARLGPGRLRPQQPGGRMELPD